MSTYQGHKNWNCWNVALHLGDDEGLYEMARRIKRRSTTTREAAQLLLEALKESGVTETPDGAPYSHTAIMLALRGM